MYASDFTSTQLYLLYVWRRHHMLGSQEALQSTMRDYAHGSTWKALMRRGVVEATGPLNVNVRLSDEAWALAGRLARKSRTQRDVIVECATEAEADKRDRAAAVRTVTFG